jgi:LacI family transcriptional regulator
LGVLGLGQRGIKIPEDLSVIGYDNINLAKIVTPALTTIAQPTYQMGRQAVKLLIAKMIRDKHDSKAPKQLMLFPPELIVRNSCVPNVK